MKTPNKQMKGWLVLLLLTSMLCTTVLVGAQEPQQPLLPPSGQVVRQEANLIDAEGLPIGTAQYWNTRENFVVELFIADGWQLTDSQVYFSTEPPPLKKDKPVPGKFPCKRDFAADQDNVLYCSLEGELGYQWGWDRTRYAAIHGDLVQTAEDGTVVATNDFWVEPILEEGDTHEYFLWPALNHGGYFETTIYHPSRGHFIDSPVAGLTYQTPTNWGTTDGSGGFDYFPGERVKLWLGSVYLGDPLADHKISPLDIYEGLDTTPIEGNPVINMARLLQSLDADGYPKGGIEILPSVSACLDLAMDDLDYVQVNFADDTQVEDLINQTLARCAETPDVDLAKVSAEQAKANLDANLDSNMFRKNVSKTPELSSSKSKLNIMGMWFPALKADDTENPVDYYDEDGTLLRTAYEAKPIVVAYTDAVEETDKEDIFAAVSRDDGNTFKRMNIARAADKSSFTLANGEEYYGEAKKPVMAVQGNNIMVAWTSKFCNGGRPTYAIDLEDDYPYDDPYFEEDIWGVAGPQRSVDYTDEGFPEVGEVPYSCVWVARGTIVTEEMLADTDSYWARNGYIEGKIQWFKPERLTSGRRDANQVFMGSFNGAGFAIAWQEDPEGLRPGQALGPGPGWGGATTNHKTDIWYSYIHMDNFLLVDENFVPGGDPIHEDPEVLGRPKALVPMSLPVRVTDNDVVNSDNIMATTTDFETWAPIENPNADPEAQGDADGTHAYGYVIDGLCEGWYEKVNEQGETKNVCITDDGRLLDGDTGASRPNLFLQGYTKQGDNPATSAVESSYTSAWAIFAYDESKGMGAGAPDHEPGGGPYGDEYLPESGKNSLYHSFDFMNPDLVSAGTIINLPEKEYTVDENGVVSIVSNITYVQDEEGTLILDYLGQPQINYENARRPRFIIQGKKAAVDSESNTIMMILYKEGEEGSGRPSDIMLRRVVVPDGQTGNPYRPQNIVCNTWELADNGQTVCVDGAQNMSTVHPTVTTDSQGDPTSEDPYGAVKVVQWEQTVDTLANPSGVNPYEDARAHRGAIMGDFVVMGYSYTPNWAAYRNGNDKYDFFVRRSFDGGQTWTTDPNGAGVTNCDTFTDPSSKEKTEVCVDYGPGEFEQARNMSQLPNSKSSVIEPRIVKAPGTIKNPDGTATGYPEDINRFGMYYVSYGTSTNERDEQAAPMDLYYSFSLDLGESYVEVEWDVNPDSDGNYAGETVYRWDYLAKGDPEQGEAQLRMTPDGSRFYAVWVQEDEYSSDIWFRRIMSPEFPANVAQ